MYQTQINQLMVFSVDDILPSRVSDRELGKNSPDNKTNTENISNKQVEVICGDVAFDNRIKCLIFYLKNQPNLLKTKDQLK